MTRSKCVNGARQGLGERRYAVGHAGRHIEQAAGPDMHPFGESPRRKGSALAAEPRFTLAAGEARAAAAREIGFHYDATLAGDESDDLVASDPGEGRGACSHRTFGMAPSVQIRAADPACSDLDLDEAVLRCREGRVPHHNALGTFEEGRSHQKRNRGTGGFIEYSTTP